MAAFSATVPVETEVIVGAWFPETKVVILSSSILSTIQLNPVPSLVIISALDIAVYSGPDKEARHSQ